MSDDKDLALKPNQESKTSTKNALVAQFRELDKKTESWIQSWNPYHPAVIRNRGFEPVAIAESKIKKQLTKFFLIAFGVFLLWAFFAPIDSGVPTQGTVMVSGYRKQLQHPTGGIIQEILVKEDQVVNEGDVLIRINPLKAQAELSTAQLQYINALVTEARLKAERKGEGKITWPAELQTWETEAKVKDAKVIQQKLFETRRSEFNQMISAKREQLVTITEEANNTAQLAKEGFVAKSQANQLMRSKLDAELAVKNVEANYHKDIDTQLAQIHATREAMKDRFEAVSMDRDLTSIRAPVSGTIVGLKVNTVGGMAPGGQVLAEIIPAEGRLVIEAKVPPNLIDKVKEGLVAHLRFTSFNVDTTPVIDGTVTRVGNDKQPAPAGGADAQDFYLAQVEATPEGMEQLGKLKVQPGMPVDVIFVTGQRTFMSYLLKPITDKFAMSFK